METARFRQASGSPGPSRPGSSPQAGGKRTVSIDRPSRERGTMGSAGGSAASGGPRTKGARSTAPPEARSDLGW